MFMKRFMCRYQQTIKRRNMSVGTLISQSKVVWPWSDASPNTNERKDASAYGFYERLDVEATSLRFHESAPFF